MAAVNGDLRVNDEGMVTHAEWYLVNMHSVQVSAMAVEFSC
ncbi:hypothetical protein [Corynebacterium yonathiae]|uniref:Uncharacterized protein n=1 Tax=Corynebacterium yonathiae TaxID=2913504 RepID=A0ABU8Y1I8_9CORY|nr:MULTISPECIES: hypothetical protein [Corynebacterium]MDK2582351.1 hypothetical protein [Corynebacterium sp. BWA136]